MTNDISKLANMMIEVEGGERCPLAFHIHLKEMAEAIKEFQDQVKPLALTEASKWHGQVYLGYEITKKAGGGRYNYDHIPEIIELKNHVKELEKQAQYAYKTTTQGLLISADGELITPAQYIQNDDTIQIKLAK
tara:strand:+ start:117 stop:518 length:402 start_codon:yes stop_codon:yes gene_type:complete